MKDGGFSSTQEQPQVAFSLYLAEICAQVALGVFSGHSVDRRKKFAHLEQLEFVRNYQIFEMQGVLPGADEVELGRAYREFSRRRYAEARSRGRLGRESEVIQLIIREWETLSIPQRLAFLPE